MNIHNRYYCNSLNQLVYESIRDIILYGFESDTRNGGAKALYNTDLILTNPRARHLYLKGRTNNIFGTLGETFWVLAGKKDIKPHLEFFVPRAKLYSDDKRTWNASYGDRLWSYDQFDHIFKMFEIDGLYTRRATQSIFIPGYDTYKDYSKRQDTMKDIPCNQWISYFVIPEDDINPNRLYMKVAQRSGDIIFGTGNINIPEFTIIQEMVLSVLKEMYPDKNIELGDYIQTVSNLHLYNETYQQGLNIVENSQGRNIQESELDNTKMHFSKKDKLLEFFNAIYDFQVNLILGYNIDITIEKIFNHYDVKIEDNLLYHYAKIVNWYIESKIKNYNKENKNPLTKQDQEILNKIKQTPGLFNSIKNSGFRNFEIE